MAASSKEEYAICKSEIRCPVKFSGLGMTNFLVNSGVHCIRISSPPFAGAAGFHRFRQKLDRDFLFAGEIAVQDLFDLVWRHSLKFGEVGVDTIRISINNRRLRRARWLCRCWSRARAVCRSESGFSPSPIPPLSRHPLESCRVCSCERLLRLRRGFSAGENHPHGEQTEVLVQVGIEGSAVARSAAHRRAIDKAAKIRRRTKFPPPVRSAGASSLRIDGAR